MLLPHKQELYCRCLSAGKFFFLEGVKDNMPLFLIIAYCFDCFCFVFNIFFGGGDNVSEESIPPLAESFLEFLKMTSIGLKLDRLQLRHWLLFLEHNSLRFYNSNVVVGLLVPIGHDYVYDSACDSFGPLILSALGSSACRT